MLHCHLLRPFALLWAWLNTDFFLQICIAYVLNMVRTIFIRSKIFHALLTLYFFWFNLKCESWEFGHIKYDELSRRLCHSGSAKVSTFETAQIRSSWLTDRATDQQPQICQKRDNFDIWTGGGDVLSPPPLSCVFWYVGRGGGNLSKESDLKKGIFFRTEIMANCIYTLLWMSKLWKCLTHPTILTRLIVLCRKKNWNRQ